MNDDMRTAEKFMQAVNAMKQTLDTKELEKDIDLEIAGRHNLRRKLRMIRSMWRSGTTRRPRPGTVRKTTD